MELAGKSRMEVFKTKRPGATVETRSKPERGVVRLRIAGGQGIALTLEAL